MRGDSRRDLYAKALALCGLGVLAGAGAVVDYWPVGVRFPTAMALAGNPIAAVTTSAPAMSDETLARLETAGAPLAPPSIPSTTPAVLTSAVDDFATAHVAGADAAWPVMATGFAPGEPLPANRLSAPVVTYVRYDLPAVPTPFLLTIPAAQVPDVGDRLAAAFAGPVASGDDDNGFIRTAVRKTGSSIVRTGVVTGSSLVDAVRIVGSAVRRALP